MMEIQSFYEQLVTSSITRAEKKNSEMVALSQTWKFATQQPPSAQITRQTPLHCEPSLATPIRMVLRARYFDPASGEFTSPDPLEYVDGMSLFRGYFVPGAVDPFGLDWKIVRKGEAWAEAIPDSGQDTIEELAKLIKLNVSEHEKWLKISSDPHWGDTVDTSATVESQWCGLPQFHVPNTWGIFQTQRAWNDLSLAARHCRGLAENGYYMASLDGFKVEFAYKDKREFENLWQLDGIYAFTAGGHGAKEGFEIPAYDSESIQDTVSPFDVRPPYKLARVAIFSCHSGDDIPDTNSNPPRPPRSWRFHVSDSGEFIGHEGPYYLWSRWQRK